MGQAEWKDAWAVEQVFYGSRPVHTGAERRLHHPGNEPGVFNRVLFPLVIDTFVMRLVQNTPIDE